MSSDELEESQFAEAAWPPPEPEASGPLQREHHLAGLLEGEPDFGEDATDLEEALREALLNNFPGATPEEIDELLFDAMAPVPMESSTRRNVPPPTEPRGAEALEAPVTATGSADEPQPNAPIRAQSPVTAASLPSSAGEAGARAAEAGALSRSRMSPPKDLNTRGLVTVRVITSAQTAVTDAVVAAYDVGLDGETKIGDGISDGTGGYTVEYDRAALGAGRSPDIRARASIGDQEIGASDIFYNAPVEVTVIVVVSADAVLRDAEHTRIVSDLAPHLEGVPDRKTLGDLQETDARHDITYLANKTGWDARAVAMAATADRMARGTKLPSELFYALFRAGVPASSDVLARTRPERAVEIWKRSIETGVIPRELTQSLPKFARQFTQIAANALLDQPAVIGVSPLTDILGVAGLDDAQRKQVAAAYTATADRSEFWSTIEQQIGGDATKRLANAAGWPI